MTPAVIIDRGACAFIQEKGIQVTKGTPLGKVLIPEKIKVSFSKNLKISPLLQPLDPDGVLVFAKRGSAHDWIFELSYSSMITTDDPGFSRRYRLEIL